MASIRFMNNTNWCVYIYEIIAIDSYYRCATNIDYM